MKKRNNFSKKDISKNINEKFGISVNNAKKIFEDFIDVLTAGLKDDSFVKIKDFGTFKILEKNKRIGRNPKTKENYIISERKTVSFKPSKKIKEKINPNV